MEGLVDTNATPAQGKEYVSDPNAIVAQLQADAKAKREADATARTTPATVTTEAPKETVSTPQPDKPVDRTKPDSLQQFRDKEGNVDPQKIEKSNEHLQKLADDKEARLQSLIKMNKELRRKESEASKGIKQEEGRLAEVYPELVTGKMSPEFKQKLHSDLEKDPVEAIVNLAALVAEQKANEKTARFEKELASLRGETRDDSLVKELDDIGQNGHSWVYSPEGSKLFDEAFQERPWLLQSRTPYKDALRFINAPVDRQPDVTPSVRSTPTLGGGRAVPPPTSQPTVSPEQQLRDMRREAMVAIARGDMKRANELAEKMRDEDRRSIRGY